MFNFTKITELMKEKHLSQTELCEYLGVSKQLVSNWKSGVNKSFPKYLPQIAEFIGVSVDELCQNIPTTPKIAPNATILDSASVYAIPVYASCGAGISRLASNDVIEYIPVYISDPTEAAQTILVRVSGDSMYPKIENGDLIQVLKTDSCDSGQIAVVRIDDECLVKRVVCSVGYVELQSINPMYPPMRFVGDDARKLSVEGIVRRIIKEV